MEQQLMMAQIRVRDLDQEAILTQAVREIGCRLLPRVLHRTAC